MDSTELSTLGLGCALLCDPYKIRRYLEITCSRLDQQKVINVKVRYVTEPAEPVLTKAAERCQSRPVSGLQCVPDLPLGPIESVDQTQQSTLFIVSPTSAVSQRVENECEHGTYYDCTDSDNCG